MPKFKCPHCDHVISEEILERHRAYKLVAISKAKFGAGYNDEMRRRVNKRWEKYAERKRAEQ